MTLRDCLDRKIQILQESGVDSYVTFISVSSIINILLRDSACTNAVFKYSWSCIARGAVKFGANTQLQPAARKARFSYGWSTAEVYDPELHLEEDKYWDTARAEYMAGNQVHWPVKRGQEVKSENNALQYSLTFQTYARGYNKRKEQLYKSTLRNPPSRIKKGEEVDGVETYGTIEIKTPARIEDLPKKMNHAGKQFPVFEWDWDIHVSGSSVEMIAIDEDGAQVGHISISNVVS